MKTKQLSVTMTEGNGVKQIFSFMLPLLIGNIFQQLYTLVDSIVVGQFVGASALGSVGAVGSISSLLISVCIGLSGGMNVLIAQFCGAGKKQGVHKTISNSLYITLISGMIMSILGISFTKPILQMMQIPKANYNDAFIYMQIICAGMVFNALYNSISSILRGLGDSKVPLYFILISSVANVIFDILFVGIFHWNVAGAAWATLIAQIFAAVISTWYAFQKNIYFQLQKEDWKLDRMIIKKICQMGIPLAAQNCFGSLSGVVTQSIVNSFGSTVMASFTVCERISQILMQPYGTLGSAIAVFSGQNIGAKQYERIQTVIRKIFFYVEGFALLLLLFLTWKGSWMIAFFVSDPAVSSIGRIALIFLGLSYPASGLIFIYKAMLNGCGDAFFTLLSGLVEVIGRILFILCLTKIPALGIWGIWISSIPSALLSAGMCIYRYHQKKWMQY